MCRPRREGNEYMPTGRRLPNRDESLLKLRVLLIRHQQQRGVREHTFDFLTRDAMLLALGSIPFVPVETDIRDTHPI